MNGHFSVLRFVKGSSSQDARGRGGGSSGVRAEEAAGRWKPEPGGENKHAEQRLKQWENQRHTCLFSIHIGGKYAHFTVEKERFICHHQSKWVTDKHFKHY